MKKIQFKEENLPYNIMAKNDRFIICSRPMDIKADRSLLKHEVKTGAYLNIESAFIGLKDYPIYTIVDLEAKERGPHNLIFNNYDFNSIEDSEKLLIDLNSNNVQLSHRRKIQLTEYKIF